MNEQSENQSIRYSAPEDAGMQIAAEVLKVVGIVLGVAATPILLQLLDREQFQDYLPWYWIVGGVCGVLLILFGGAYAFLQARRRRQLQGINAPRLLLIERLLPPFQIVVSTRQVANQQPDVSPDIQQRLDSLRSGLSGKTVEELLPPFGYRLHPDPAMNSGSLAAQTALRKKQDALKHMRQTGQMEADEYEEALRILSQPASQSIEQKLAALKAMRESGLMSRQVYQERVKAVRKEMAASGGAIKKSWLILPTLLITLGGFILLHSLVAYLMRENGIEFDTLIAFYFSSPVFLVWVAAELLYAYPLYFARKHRKAAHLMGIIKSIVQVLAALVLWVYLGLVFGISGIEWLFYAGSGIALVGLVLGIIGAVLNRRLASQPVDASMVDVSAPDRRRQRVAADPSFAHGQPGDRAPSINGQQDEQPDSGTIAPAPGVAHVSDKADEEPMLALPRPLPISGYYRYYQQEDGQFYFQLYTSENELLLSGGGVTTRTAGLSLIGQVKQAGLYTERYQRESVAAGNHAFALLTDGAQQILAQSPPTSDGNEVAWLIAAAQSVALLAPLRDETKETVPTSAASPLAPGQIDKEQQPLQETEPAPTAMDTRPVDAPAERDAHDEEKRPKNQLDKEATDQAPQKMADESVSSIQPPSQTSPLSGGQQMETPEPAVAPSPDQPTATDPPQPSVPHLKGLKIVTDAKAPKFQLFEGQDGQYYFHLLARNGEIILASEGYRELRGALNGIRSVKKNASNETRFVRREASNGQPYFVLRAGNYQVIGNSELYTTVANRENGIAAVQRVATNAPVEMRPVELNPTDTAARLVLESASETEAVSSRSTEAPEPVPIDEMKPPKFQLFIGKNDQYYFHLMAANREIILASEGYQTKRGCQNGIRSVKKNGVLEERYKRLTAQNGQPYFQLTAGNYQVIGMSETYTTAQNLEKGIAAVKRVVVDAPVEDLAGQQAAGMDT